MNQPEIIDIIRALLEKHTTLTIATVDGEGWPRAADVFYTCDDALNWYLVSGEQSRHAMNLAHVSRVAVTIHTAHG